MELDLLSLPPPPLKAKRGKTRISIPVANPLLIKNIIYKDTDVCLLEKSVFMSHTKKYNVLLKISMEQRDTTCVTVPIFTKTGRAYPEKTKIACWWCKCAFSTRPVGCPYKENFKKKVYICEGIFCSFSCAMAYGNDSNSNRFRFCGSKLLLMRKSMLGVPYSIPLLPAHHWSCLKKYGGHMSLQAFRAKNCVRTKAIPEAVKVYAYGFNVFDVDKTRQKSTYSVIKRANYSHRKQSTVNHIRKKKMKFEKCVSKFSYTTCKKNNNYKRINKYLEQIKKTNKKVKTITI